MPARVFQKWNTLPRTSYGLGSIDSNTPVKSAPRSRSPALRRSLFHGLHSAQAPAASILSEQEDERYTMITGRS